MPTPIPFATRKKDLPSDPPGFPEKPAESEIKEADIQAVPTKKDIPEKENLKEDIPDETPQKEETPDVVPEKEETPTTMNMENVVEIGGQKIEIKPTKVKYFRNKTTQPYGYLKAIPLNEFLTYDKGVLSKQMDADQLLFNFLVAVFDDSEFVRDNYDEMTADNIDRIIKIFGRINHIDEKEEAARKNREAQAAKH